MLPQSGQELSSAQVFNKKILEIVIVKIENKFYVFQTQAVQNIDHWVKKDVGRPFIDDRLGMLPLKAARMMLNLGIGGLEGIDGIEGIDKIAFLDPFCGMGSILEEAVDAGFQNIIGGDINAQVLEKCRKNLDRFQKSFNYQNVQVKLIESDAVKISEKTGGVKINMIVTEPFLGDPHRLQKINQQKGDTIAELKKIVKGLEKMYLGSLKNWKNILHNKGVVCIIVPEITMGNRVFTIPFVEMCGKLGYNIVDGPFEYAREQAIVKRKVYLLSTQVKS